MSNIYYDIQEHQQWEVLRLANPLICTGYFLIYTLSSLSIRYGYEIW